MKRSTIKMIGWIVGIIASIIVISGAVKSGVEKYREKANNSNETAQVQVVDTAA